MVANKSLIVSLTLVFVGIMLSQQGAATDANRPYPCYWITGRMMASNGGTPVKIWPRNTKRLLGVVNDEELPTEIRQLQLSFDRSIWGEFWVCPTTKERKGWMRFVKVTKGRNLKMVDYK